MTDHAGNIIQTGDTILIVDTIREDGSMGWEIQNRMPVIFDCPEVFVGEMISQTYVVVHHLNSVM